MQKNTIDGFVSEIERLKKELNEKDKLIEKLEAQIEKMKCCMMCKYYDFTQPNYCHKGVYRERQMVCSKWEFGN